MTVGDVEARRKAAQSLRKLAQQYNVERVGDKASKAKVAAMAQSILQGESLTAEDKELTETALAAHAATYATPPSEAEAEEPVAADDVEKPKIWCFRAVQLTYNKIDGDWASTSPGILSALFDRLCDFARELGVLLSAAGISATLERSLATDQHVHAHIYVHSKTPYRRQGADALQPFIFEGIHPHLAPNTASGRDYEGAVRFGHFYVYADKIGTIAAWCCCCCCCCFQLSSPVANRQRRLPVVNARCQSPDI
jgi:hypothetical protein